MSSVAWTTKSQTLEPFNADSVEWCPVEPYHHVLVCGTYQLDKDGGDNTSAAWQRPPSGRSQAPNSLLCSVCAQEFQMLLGKLAPFLTSCPLSGQTGVKNETSATDKAKKQKRLGRISLYIVDENGQPALSHTVETAGVLDQKWCYHRVDGFPILAVVTSVGDLKLYRLKENDEGKLRLEQWLEYSIGENVLALSLDWSTNKTVSEHRIVVSDSSGAVTVLKLVGNGLEKVGEWKSHGYEAWIAAFNYWDHCVFYSGGDDCVFKRYDARMADVAVRCNRSHGAGVTAIRSHTEVEHQLATGSYDEIIRLWDERSLKRCITETNVNGGVWRLKWHPSKRDIILAACMYGGFRILKVDAELKVIGEYMEHESIAYGADWQFRETPLVATCSFYDCKMHISDVNV